MHFKISVHIVFLALACCFCPMGANAQTENPKQEAEPTSGTTGVLINRPYTLLEPSDQWNNQKGYSYLFGTAAPTLTPKGGTEPMKTLANRGPVLNRPCFDAEDPAQCTEDFIKTKFHNTYHPSINYPVGYSGTEYVVFELDANGKLASGYQVVGQSVTCEACAQAAVNAVAYLEGEWSPALQNGITTKATIVIPIGFYVTISGDDK